eukprot:25098_1
MVALILGVTFVMGIAGLATTRAWAKIEVRYSEPIGAALQSASPNRLLQVSTLSGDANMVSIEIGSLNAVAQAGLQSTSGGIGGGSSGGGDGGSSSGGGNGGSSSGGGNGGSSSGGGRGGGGNVIGSGGSSGGGGGGDGGGVQNYCPSGGCHYERIAHSPVNLLDVPEALSSALEYPLSQFCENVDPPVFDQAKCQDAVTLIQGTFGLLLLATFVCFVALAAVGRSLMTLDPIRKCGLVTTASLVGFVTVTSAIAIGMYVLAEKKFRDAVIGDDVLVSYNFLIGFWLCLSVVACSGAASIFMGLSLVQKRADHRRLLETDVHDTNMMA